MSILLRPGWTPARNLRDISAKKMLSGGTKITTLGLFLLTLLLVSSSVSSCINRKRVLSAGSGQVNVAALAEEAEVLFSLSPRTVERLTGAYQLMAKAAEQSSNEDPLRFGYLFRAAWFGSLLAYHNEDKDVATEYAEEAIVLGNTAVQLQPSRIEGYYYRAIAIGVFADLNKIYGLDAMRKIREDATKALVMDPAFDEAGPHRVLGALYLRAPGPPTGVGSIRRAFSHLSEAHQLFPDNPENILFLAEVYLKMKRYEEAGRLLEQAPSILDVAEPLDRPKWEERITSIRTQIEEHK